MTEGVMRQKGGYSVTREAAVSAGAPAKVNNVYYPKSILDFSVAGNADSGLHPTQKPVKLYEWLLANYAKQGDRILDTHLGSGSSAIAAHYGGFDFVGCELDTDYFNAASKRFEQATAQMAMFGA